MTNLKAEDAILSELASLYESRGYKRYKPGCFEDYSLYLENIDFLISKNVITFSGAEGRLLALRPDVTLSVISHIQCCGQTDKLFYAEKVYRRSGGGEFRDINQTGVEVVGNIDRACEAEVACLVVDTLSTVSGDYLLDLSHMGYIKNAGMISNRIVFVYNTSILHRHIPAAKLNHLGAKFLMCIIKYSLFPHKIPFVDSYSLVLDYFLYYVKKVIKSVNKF